MTNVVRPSKLERPARATSIVLLVAWSALLADALSRRNFEHFDVGRHLVASALLYTVAGALAGSFAWILLELSTMLRARVARRYPSRADLVQPAVFGLVAVLLSYDTARWMFSGEGVRGSLVARVGPFVVLSGAAVAAAGVTVLTHRALAAYDAGRRVLPALVVSGLAVLAVGLVVVDLTVYVSLYSRLHTAVEVTAGVCGVAVTTVLVSVARRAAPNAVSRASLGVWALGLAISAAYLLSNKVRAFAEESLEHVWREPVYVGRMLSRLQVAESFLKNPRGWNDATMSSVQRLRHRYDIATTARSPVWDEPRVEQDALRDKLVAMRGDKDHNIVFYYVDTLRADTAFDKAVMPNVHEFGKASLVFRNVYTTGSDTLHALPGLTGGNYDLFEQHPNDLLNVARNAGMQTALVAATSAREFLQKLLPTFRFDETIDVPDYQAGNIEVWGYGADQPTASRIVDSALQWMNERRGERFLAWLFNFDVHNWRELDEAYVVDAAKTYGMPDKHVGAGRYRIVARALDAQFGRFIEGLEELGLHENTIVVFVSDHGEGLGREGFWVHSIFLWEALVRVPLLIRIPGQAAAVVQDRVSLVDVAPTLARYVVPEADMTGYHGEDLLSYLLPDRPRRRLPLMLAGTSKEQLVRLGIISPYEPWKLVLPLEGVVPELYDLRAPDPDARNVAQEHPTEMLRLLNDLVRAPLFPRLNAKAAAEGGAPQAKN